MTTAPTSERPQVTITLPPLHASQQEIAAHPARYRVVCCGRRWGKSMLGIFCCLRSAIEGGRVWWIAPSYKVALEGWSYLQRLVMQMPAGLARTHLSELMVTFSGGGSIQIRTGDNPDNLRGAGLDGVVLDEYATMKPETWDLVIRPALADKQGWAMFISTPAHFNHFWELYERGEDPEYPDWASWQRPTWDNPYIPEAEIEAAQRDMEVQDFDQEFGASFTAVGGAIFPLLSANRQMYLRPMPVGMEFRRTGVGMDWGTTKEHLSAVVNGARMSSGAVWIRSSWLSDSGSSDDWVDEAVRMKRDYGAEFARVDRSQSSILDRLKHLGFQADKGVADQDARIGNAMGLIRRNALFFNSDDPGVRTLYNHLCSYHRNPDTGKPEEEDDDDVDGFLYLVAELVNPTADKSQGWDSGAPLVSNAQAQQGMIRTGV